MSFPRRRRSLQPVSTEPILHEGAHVTLDVGGDATAVSCRVVGLTGDELALLPLRPPEPAAWRRLAMRGPCVVFFEAGGQMRALRGSAAGVRSGGFLAVALTDAFRLGQKRRHSRAPLEFPVELTDPAAGDAWSSESMDISATGLRVRRPDVDDPAPSGTITIALPEDEQVVAPATLVTAAPTWLSYRFGDIAPEARQRLAGLVLAHHRAQLGSRRAG
jgi:hypothetical protein